MISLLVFLFLGSAQASDLIHKEKGWVLEYDKKGIKLYSHPETKGTIIPFKGEMLVDHPMAEVAAVLDDRKRRMEWVDRFKENILLEKISYFERVEYGRVAFPLWFKDRTAVVKLKIEVSKDLKTLYIFGKSIPYENEKLFKGVRASIYDSTVKLESLGKKTHITVMAYADPNGAIPDWVVNLFTGVVARKTLMNLRDQLGKNLYSAEYIEGYRKMIRNYHR